MSSIKLSKSERLELKELHKAKNVRKAADRIKTILLLDDDYSYSRISKVLFLDDQTIRNYEKFKQFRNAVFGFFENIEKYKKELSTLLVDNFQIIGN
jgi:hypothetical protein